MPSVTRILNTDFPFSCKCKMYVNMGHAGSLRINDLVASNLSLTKGVVFQYSLLYHSICFSGWSLLTLFRFSDVLVVTSVKISLIASSSFPLCCKMYHIQMKFLLFLESFIFLNLPDTFQTFPKQCSVFLIFPWFSGK